MSQSPQNLSAALADVKASDRYKLGWKALTELIGQGRSFSGNESNCFFLNTRDGRFTDASATTGLSLYDDGRAVAVCDWDFDGRQDIWVSNRNAPRVRLLRNSSRGGDWLALRLSGTLSNKDAIGARVVIDLGDNKLRSKTVRAGDGFLAQSSKWLHFGLGNKATISSAKVYWPGGKVEKISGLKINQYHTIEQGKEQAVLWKPPTGNSAIKTSKITFNELNDNTRTWLIGRIPLPRLEGIPDTGDSPKLINLWSESCAPCVAEISEWTKHEKQIRDAGLDIFALNVGLLDENQRKTTPITFPFNSGKASPEILDVLDIFHRTFVELQQPLPIPTSFLLDKEGRVAAIYKGHVPLSTLLDDVALLSKPESEARDAAVPFSGRWASDLFPPQAIRLAESFATAGNPSLRKRYLKDYLLRFESEETRLYLGRILLDENNLEQAVRVFAGISATTEKEADYHRSAGILLLKYNQIRPARNHLRVALSVYKDNPDFRFNLGIAEAGSGNLVESLNHFRACVRMKPTDAVAHFQLGNALQATGKGHDAVTHYRKSLQVRPGWMFPANNLAWLLSTHPDSELRNGEEAVKLISPIIKADGGKNHTTLSTLAAALAETGDFKGAIETTTRALHYAQSVGANDAGLRAALSNYRNGKAFRGK